MLTQRTSTLIVTERPTSAPHQTSKDSEIIETLSKQLAEAENQLDAIAETLDSAVEVFRDSVTEAIELHITAYEKDIDTLVEQRIKASLNETD